MSHFKFYNKQDVLSLTRIRRFETKLGERVQVLGDANALENSLQNSSASYVLLGIPEDIGVKANMGIGGADSAWLSFLQSFLNIQSNDFFEGGNILLLGHFDFSNIEKLIEQNAHDFRLGVSPDRADHAGIDIGHVHLVFNISAVRRPRITNLESVALKSLAHAWWAILVALCSVSSQRCSIPTCATFSAS